MRPNLHRPETASPADLALCREMIRTGSRSFYAASLLLPDQARAGAYALYAFCRLSDDSVDIDSGGAAAVARLGARLDRIYAGAPSDHGVDRALADTVERYAMPRAPFDALLEGLYWDAEGRRCDTLDDLYAYAARVAGAVGVMMSVLMGARAPELIARAVDLGVGMQLTNVARDVGEDARAGRLYLPRIWFDEVGLDPDAWLETPEFNDAIGVMTERLLRAADELYARADVGIAALPRAYRPAIYAARLLYAEIGHELRRRGGNAVAARSVVGAGRKLHLVTRAFTRRWKPPAQPQLRAPALSQTQFLVDAIGSHNDQHDVGAHGAGLTHDVHWVIDLFAALEERPRRIA